MTRTEDKYELEKCYKELYDKDKIIERQQNMINQMSAAIGRRVWRDMVKKACRRKNRRQFNWR